MKYRIHNGDSSDSITIEGDSLIECQEQAKNEVELRGWTNPWSEEVKEK